MTAETDFTGWVPYALHTDAIGQRVEWQFLGERRFTEPFFDHTIFLQQQTVGARNGHRVTDASALDRVTDSIPPTGFIFHLARCGSTLVCQMLAALETNLVHSEPCIVGTVLHGARHKSASQSEASALLRRVIGALGQRRSPREQHYFIKFGGRSITQLPVIHEAFPNVPWILLYRDPVEILQAHIQQAHNRLPPGLENSGMVAGDPDEIRRMSPVEFWARALGNCSAAALRHRGLGRGLLVNYEQLPEIVYERLARHFSVTLSAQEVELMRKAAYFNAKNPTQAFSSDRERKRQVASPELQALAEQWMMPHYRELEALRCM